MAAPPLILISSADSSTKELLSACISEHCALRQQFTNERALPEAVVTAKPDIALIDCSTLSAADTQHVLAKVLGLHSPLVVLPIISENQRSSLRAVQALEIRFTLFSPIDKNEVKETLLHIIANQLQHKSAEQATEEQNRFYGMIGASPSMKKLFDLVSRIADDDVATVLIRGESGTGKEMVARAIHAHSARSHRNFVPVNCAAIPDDLLESELFGYTKGAFTGAAANKQGRIQYADGGTLFLDEIGDMKPSLQAKLLRVLQEKEFEPVGALKPIPVDTRILAATHCDLEQFVKEGKFREDLYYRLSVIPVNIPSLKERKEDIPLLINSFVDQFAQKRSREPFRFTRKALAALMHFEWRGNVRELENLIQHMSVLYSGKEVSYEDLPEKFQGLPDEFFTEFIESEKNVADEAPDQPAAMPSSLSDNLFSTDWQNGQIDFNSLVSEFEIQLISQAMRFAAGNKKEAARLLNLKRTTLLEKIKKKDLNFGEDS